MATLVFTAIALLKPDEADAPAADVPDSVAAASPATDARHAGTPWVRVPIEPWKPPQGDMQKPADPVPALPPAVPPEPAADVPRPVAPDPALTYLGRLEQDGRRYVFLGRGADPQVVEIGGLVDSQWRVEDLNAIEVRLRYLPLSEIRSIPVAALP